MALDVNVLPCYPPGTTCSTIFSAIFMLRVFVFILYAENGSVVINLLLLYEITIVPRRHPVQGHCNPAFHRRDWVRYLLLKLLPRESKNPPVWTGD